jgi:hypothetical protein
MSRLAATITAALFAASALLGASLPLREPVLDECQTVEVNFLFDEQGDPVFVQLIWLDEAGVVIAWRLVKSPRMLPVLDRRLNRYVCAWHDGDTFREVRARELKETWTQYDPELAQREFVPICQRRGLTSPGGLR